VISFTKSSRNKRKVCMKNDVCEDKTVLQEDKTKRNNLNKKSKGKVIINYPNNIYVYTIKYIACNN